MTLGALLVGVAAATFAIGVNLSVTKAIAQIDRGEASPVRAEVAGPGVDPSAVGAWLAADPETDRFVAIGQTDAAVPLVGTVPFVGYDLEGKELWRRELPIPKNTFGTAASPVMVGGKLIFLADAEESSCMEAIEPASGKTLWRQDRARFKSGWSTPAVWTRAGSSGEKIEELLVLGVGWLTAHDLADGSERWSYPGLTDEPIRLVHNYWGVLFSIVITGFPFAFLLIQSYLSGIDPSLEKAAATLGAGWWSRFWRITLPLLAPGLATTFCLTFVLAFSVFPSAIDMIRTAIGMSPPPIPSG